MKTMIPRSCQCPNCGNRDLTQMEWVVSVEVTPRTSYGFTRSFVGVRCLRCSYLEKPETDDRYEVRAS